MSATPVCEDTVIPFTDLIHPHTGDIHEDQPVSSGYSWSTTFLLNSEKGKFFVKGVPNRPGGRLDSARREADINPFIRGICPTMRWQAEDKKWFVMGFDVIEGRPANFLPGSADLHRVAAALNRVSALPSPQVALEWEETRWDRFVTEEDRKHLAGNSLTYTDIHGNNVLLSEDQTWLIDWAWPTRGASVITPSCWAVQLISAGHSPESALSWVSRLDAWKESTPESIAAFTQADVLQYEWQVEARPGQDWLKAMLDAAKAWHQHLKE